MAILTIPDNNIRIEDQTAIRKYLNDRNIWFDNWQANAEFESDADQETILAAYADSLQPFMQSKGYHTADVINISPNTPNLLALRQKFLKEHTHSEDEVRYFVEGQGFFWFNLGQAEPVFNVLCQRGDLISVPAGTPHWFDLGNPPRVKAIRIFIDQSGWVPDYTGSDVDNRYNPIYES